MINRFPHIARLGSRESEGVFDSDVQITEKIDGSTFAFGKLHGKVRMRTNSQEIQLGQHPEMFRNAVMVVQELKDRLPEDVIFYGEYLRKNRHNALTYGRIPKNHIMIFGILANGEWITDYNKMAAYAESFGFESVPLLFQGKVTSFKDIEPLLEGESILGGRMEGVVIKNFAQTMHYKDKEQLQFIKFVNDSFKEVRHISKDAKQIGRLGETLQTKSNLDGLQLDLDILTQAFVTDARCHKTIQHLHEDGKLKLDYCDFPVLMKELASDFISEEKLSCIEELKKLLVGRCDERLIDQSADNLWKQIFSKQVCKALQHKMTGIYKAWLLER